MFSPLTYNGEVTKLTWPKVTDIKNLKYTNYRHLCPYCAMRVSKSSFHWCAFGKMSNFEKHSLRSGHLMRPGHVTFEVIGSSFFRKCCQIVGWIATANLAALRAAVFSLSAKNCKGGGGNQSPAGARVKTTINCIIWRDVYLSGLQNCFLGFSFF